MVRWAQGAERIVAMIERDELQEIPSGVETALALLEMAERHVEAAGACVDIDVVGAYAMAYDAARKSATAVLAHQGLRPTTRGGHVAVVDAVEAQFPGVPGFVSLDRVRRRRNQLEYPDPARYDAITIEESSEAIAVALAVIDAARTLMGRRELGLFR